jgi:hypothetical protein
MMEEEQGFEFYPGWAFRRSFVVLEEASSILPETVRDRRMFAITNTRLVDSQTPKVLGLPASHGLHRCCTHQRSASFDKFWEDRHT